MLSQFQYLSDPITPILISQRDYLSYMCTPAKQEFRLCQISSAVQCSAVQCITVYYSAVQLSAEQGTTVQCRSVYYSEVQFSAELCTTVQCSAINHSAVH